MRAPFRMPVALLVTTIAIALAASPAVAAPPANDDFANAQVLSNDRGMAYFDLSESTTEATEPLAVGAIARTIWFSYTPSTTGLVKFSVCSPDPGLAIAGANLSAFSGPSLDALVSEANSSGNCPVDQVNAEIAQLSVNAGITYSLQLGSTADTEILGGSLIYDFNSAPPANDDFADATEITGALPQTIDADNGLATRGLDEPGDDFWGPWNSLWYRWTSDFDGVLSIDTCSTSSNGETAVDSRVNIYTEDGAPAELFGLSLFGTAGDGCQQPKTLLSHEYFYVTSGTEYWINLSNVADQFGHDYKLRLRRVVDPETTADPYIFPNGGQPQVGGTYSIGDYEWAADPGIGAFEYQWLRCDSDGNGCSEIDGATTVSYVVQAVDLGYRLRARITARNGVASTAATSAATELVVDTPPPPADAGGTPGSPPPAPAVDPFPTPNPFAKSLGKLKVTNKNRLKLSKLNLDCGATATGPCVGTLTIRTAKTKTKVKGRSTTIKSVTQRFKLSVAPGSKLLTTFKLNSALVKAIKLARSLKTSIAIKLGAPGFSVKSLSTGATLSLRLEAR
ncbi:MAG: hypothetical protein HYX29_11435 [Solirubrobacterales bacterium]|nr:hypothetical protein [Solirubrobacterales bacterium]